MSRILKAYSVTVDEDNKVQVEIPRYDFTETQFEETELHQEDTENTAESIIEQAEEEAHRIIEEAKIRSQEEIEEDRRAAEKEIEELKKAEKEKAYEKGYDLGVADAEKVKKEAQDVLKAAHEEKERLIESAEPQIIKLITDISEKLLSKAVLFNPDLIIVLIKAGLAETTLTGNIFIHVSKDDYEYVTENREQLDSILETGAKLEIIKDVSLTTADCIIETPFGNIDSSLDQQLKLLKESLFYIGSI